MQGAEVRRSHVQRIILRPGYKRLFPWQTWRGAGPISGAGSGGYLAGVKDPEVGDEGGHVCVCGLIDVVLGQPLLEGLDQALHGAGALVGDQVAAGRLGPLGGGDVRPGHVAHVHGCGQPGRRELALQPVLHAGGAQRQQGCLNRSRF